MRCTSAPVRLTTFKQPSSKASHSKERSVDGGAADWGYRLGELVGPRLRVAMFDHRRPFTVTAEDTHRSTFAGPGSYTGRRTATVTFTPVGNEPTVEELSASPITVLHRGGLRARLLPPGPPTYTWQMKRSHDPQWTDLGTTTLPVFFHTFRIAGNFKVRVIARVARPPFRLVSGAKPLEVRFPTLDQISTIVLFSPSPSMRGPLTLSYANRAGAARGRFLDVAQYMLGKLRPYEADSGSRSGTT